MIEGNSSDDLARQRAALGDLTNIPGKRPFSAISDETALKSGDGHGENEGTLDVDPKFVETVYLGVVKWMKENCKTQSGAASSQKLSAPLPSEMEASQQKVACVDAGKLVDTKDDEGKPQEPKEKSNLLDFEDAVGPSNKEIEGGLRHIGVSSLSISTSSQPCGKESEDEGICITNAKRSCSTTNEGLGSFIGGNDNKDIAVGRLGSGISRSSEWLRLPKSQSSRSFEVHRCVGLKSDECVNLDGDVDLLKACSCSFCLKAAYIWSDLHYQDIKGRLSVLKKSQREANSLAQKCGKEKNHDIHGQGNTNRSSKLEADLTNQWKSLFLNMEGIFVHESSQLQAGCVTLKDLRESCKMDLEKAVGMSSDKHFAVTVNFTDEKSMLRSGHSFVTAHLTQFGALLTNARK